MTAYPYDIRNQGRLRRHAVIFAVAVAFIGIFVLVGWLFNIRSLRRPIVDLVAMNPLTAVLFILFAISQQMLIQGNSRSVRYAALALALVIFSAALCRLMDILTGADTRIDQILFPQKIAEDLFVGQSSRMAPNTAISFVFLAVALLLLPIGRTRGELPAQYALIPVALIAFLGLLGYLYRVPVFYGVLPYTPMALHTALSFLFCVLAMLAAAPDRGIMRAFTTVFSGSHGGRYLIPAVIIVPAILGYLRLMADWSLRFPVNFGVAILVIGIIFALLALVGYNTVALNAKDALQYETQAKLEKLNRELEARVEERTLLAVNSVLRQQRIMDKMLEGAQIISFTGKYIYVNDAVAKQLRIPRENLRGQTIKNLLPVSQNTGFFETLNHCMQDRAPQHLEERLTFQDGKSGWFELSLQPVPEGVFVLSMDITERKNAEDQVRRINAELERKVEERTKQLLILNQELESFSYSVSHDLRAPLRVLDGYAEMLAERAGPVLDAESGKMLRAIQSGAARMNELIEALLDLSQLGAQDIRRAHVDMNRLVAEVLYDLPDSAKHVAEIRVADLHTAEADPALLRQVLINLLLNAVKYSAKHKNPQISIESRLTEEGIVYSVRDNGVGFDMAYADKLFGVFQRMHTASEFEGTGVGLAIVQRIIYKHGGEVWAEAEPEKGATFYFSLPV